MTIGHANQPKSSKLAWDIQRQRLASVRFACAVLSPWAAAMVCLKVWDISMAYPRMNETNRFTAAVQREMRRDTGNLNR